MAGIAAGLVGLLVSVSAVLYLGITTILAWKLAAEGPETRRLLAVPLLPVFFQNVGIPLSVLGFALRQTEISAMGALIIMTGAMLTSDRSVSLHPAVETPLLGLAAFALAAVGLFNGIF
ncbi:MAG: hypothetical protein ACE5DS_01435 [Kiloniellaceae bacterium]